MNSRLKWTLAAIIAPLTIAQGATYCVTTHPIVPSPPFDTWGTAFTNLQDALNAARSGDTIRLAGHTFNLVQQLSWTSAASQVTLRGGYAATNPAVGDGENDPLRWPTVIRQTAATRVWAISDVTNGVLDQVTLTGGNSTANSGDWNGIGIHVGRCQNFLISSCIITNNRMLLSNATKRGGGIFSVSNNWLIVSNCLIQGNHLSGTSGNSIGGGICNSLGRLRVVNTEISSNSAANSSIGAAIFNYGTNVLENCLIYGHTLTGPQPGNSGIIHNYQLSGGKLTLVNCTIVSNAFAAGTGSGVRTVSASVTAATNSIFWWNGDDDMNGAFSPAYCAIRTTDTFWTNNVNGCFTNLPLFADAATNNFRLTGLSPCKDGGVLIAGAETTRDLDGNRRVSGARIDIGAYEFADLAKGSVWTFY